MSTEPKLVHDLGGLDWQLAGFTPHEWELGTSMEIGASASAEVLPVSAPVPGSVQKALLDAGLIPDWNVGLNAKLIEWVENRHWIYETVIPDEWLTPGRRFRLRCLGLDGFGCLRLNGRQIHRFANAFLPQVIDLTPHLAETGNRLQVVFECSPRWLGQFGYTSRIKEWKPRFNYQWDWVSRMVQIGVWDRILLEAVGTGEFHSLQTVAGADADGVDPWLRVKGAVQAPPGAQVHVVLADSSRVVREETLPAADLSGTGLEWRGLDVRLWWPNGLGEQPLYSLTVELRDADGELLDQVNRRVGFRSITWGACEGAPAHADPWVCHANGKAFFLQGVNWSPVLPNFADVPAQAYRDRLETYRDLGLNIVRVWGGAFLGKSCFYDACDELGILVWQEFPLSSSGIDNYPPDDPASIETMASVAASYIERRQHHAALAVWSGGNELYDDRDGVRTNGWRPLDNSHPMLGRFAQVCSELDPSRRFVPGSPSGPRVGASEQEFGQGLHWDVHGPWKASGRLEEHWTDYWKRMDGLLHSEIGAPGPSSVEIIRRYAGDLDPMPVASTNPLWRRFPWWLEVDQFKAEFGREPETLEEYVDWGQKRQAEALRIAATACKARFPRCGGFVVWMGHDCFPCTANTAILDIDGKPKPAALALAEVFRNPVP
jgi:beta-mannosidase